MLDPDQAFRLAGLLAIIGWLGLVAGLFADRIRRSAVTAARLVIPALLAVAYIFLIGEGMRAGTGGGFGSIAAVRQLFANDAALAAGWLHYLAFDLFVGSWIVEDGGRGGIAWRLLLVPCLALTFLFGPAGLLLYLLIRVASRRTAPAREPAA